MQHESRYTSERILRCCSFTGFKSRSDEIAMTNCSKRKRKRKLVASATDKLAFLQAITPP